MTSKTLLAVFLMLAAFASGARAGDARLALLQTRNITHSGLRGTHTVALTFDDGPNANTGKVLDALAGLKVKATFFIVGRMAHTHPALLKRIAAEGHLLANHSATHPALTARYDENPDLLLAQLHDVDAQIAPLMKRGDTLYFRAPYGAWRPAHAAILNADPVLRNYVGPVFWDAGGETTMSHDGYVMSSADWDCWNRRWPAQVCAKGYLREIRRDDGGVVIMHCIQSQAADLVRMVVPALVEEGYRFVRLDAAPGYKPYETPGRGDVVAGAPPLPQNAPLRVSDVK